MKNTENKINEKNNIYTGESARKQKRAVLICIVCLASILLICGIISGIIKLMSNTSSKGSEIDTVDPLLLDKVKPDGFDIMEYDEYLRLDRNIYFTQSGVMESVDEDQYTSKGEAFEVMYEVINAIIEGDSSSYNDLMGEKTLRKSSFTQQQLYSIYVETYSIEEMTDESGRSYTEYVYRVRYKIHENNGTYRNNILSDVSRPEYFVINDKNGEFLVMDIIEKTFAKK